MANEDEVFQFKGGFIPVTTRDKEQEDAHELAKGTFLAFSLAPVDLPKGAMVLLTEFWKKPEVVSEVGFTFERIHQLTGSCVHAGGTNALFTSIAVQRIVADAPFRAFMPFTYHNYAESRRRFGRTTPGEGSLGSTFAQSLNEDGIYVWEEKQITELGLPRFRHNDGLMTTAKEEMAWSASQNPKVKEVLKYSKPHIVGSTAECKNVMAVRQMICNGYGTTWACDKYVAKGTVMNPDKDKEACVRGVFDTDGGHQTSILGVWHHPNDGYLYWNQNNWPSSVYPRDPAGGAPCGIWMREQEMERAFRTMHVEAYGLSAIQGFPPQPKVLDWLIAP